MNDRNLKDDELAIIYSPTEGLRVEMPLGDMLIGLDGAMLAGIYMRLTEGGVWADELRRWVMRELPAMSITLN